MIRDFFKKLENLDKKIINLINIGSYVALFIALMGILILVIHYKIYVSANLYHIGLGIFKLGLTTEVSFIICGVGLGLLKEKM